jgi:hypothetical protein
MKRDHSRSIVAASGASIRPSVVCVPQGTRPQKERVRRCSANDSTRAGTNSPRRVGNLSVDPLRRLPSGVFPRGGFVLGRVEHDQIKG